ncbi:MAG: glycoside hydrolase [Fluviicola sp.]|nr:glycoside hydrolase [Fluviicola sp.]
MKFLFPIIFISILTSCKILKSSSELNSIKSEIIDYTSDSCYAIGILIKKNILYTANSNGKIYSYNLSTKEKISYESKSEKIQELRDIQIINDEIVAIQSGTTGLAVHVKNKTLEIEKHQCWDSVFLNGIDVSNNIAFMMGDPIQSIFSLYKYENNKWERCVGNIAALEGEAGFSASGTNVQVLNDSTFIFVSGGSQSRYFKSNNKGKTWSSKLLPFEQGEGIGAFSVCFKDDLTGVVVGGNYTQPNNKMKNAFYTKDGGKTWEISTISPNGYRSAVHFKQGVFYTCGTNGLDYSLDYGKTWFSISKKSFFAMTSDNENLYLTSKNGKIEMFKLIK